MTEENTLDSLSEELNLIHHVPLRQLTEAVLLAAPRCFWTMPASTTGKHHPSFSQGEGGLLRHTRMVVRVARDLLDMQGVPEGDQRYSLIVSAALLHDCCKKSDDELYTAWDHPLRARQLIVRVAEEACRPACPAYTLAPELLNTLGELVSRHMGRWNTSRYSPIQLPLPRTGLERMLHTADFLASRKYLHLPEASADSP